MANFSPNIKLELPTSPEHYDIGVFNKNNMVIDSELHKLEIKNQSQDKLLATKQSLLEVSTKLDEEISRAQLSESAINDNIGIETQRALNKEQAIINELDNYLPIDGTAKDCEKLGGYSIAKTGDKWVYGTIPVVDESGVIEIGKYIDFHKNADDHSDYYIRVTAKDDGLYIGDKKILLDGEAFPLTGGTIASTTQQMLNLRYSGETGDAIISMFPNNFTNKCVTVQSTFSTLTNSVKFKIYQIMDGVVKQLFEVSDKSKDIHDPKTNTMKPIMVKGDSITPTVKETTFKIKNNELVITGFIGSTETDITDIIIKAYGSSNLNEGMRVGISTGNGVGYIQAQNFVIDCNLLTLEEIRLLQSFTSIRFSKANDSNDYPLLMPATQDFEAGFFFTNKDGRSNITTKAKILSDSSNNFFQYDLPSVFRNDKDSGTNLKLESKEWLVATGIDIKNRG